MALLQDSIEIAATVKRTFEYLSDVERVPEWLPHIEEAHRVSEIENGPGAEIAVVVDLAGKKSQGTCVIDEWEPPHRLALTSTLEIGATTTITFVLEAVGRQTRLSATVGYTLTGKGFGRMLGGLFGDRIVRGDMRTALENLKARLEVEPERRRRARPVAST